MDEKFLTLLEKECSEEFITSNEVLYLEKWDFKFMTPLYLFFKKSFKKLELEFIAGCDIWPIGGNINIRHTTLRTTVLYIHETEKQILHHIDEFFKLVGTQVHNGKRYNLDYEIASNDSGKLCLNIWWASEGAKTFEEAKEKYSSTPKICCTMSDNVYTTDANTMRIERN